MDRIEALLQRIADAVAPEPDEQARLDAEDEERAYQASKRILSEVLLTARIQRPVDADALHRQSEQPRRLP